MSLVSIAILKTRESGKGGLIGRGLHGALSALLARIKHKYGLFRDDTPLMDLWTVCIHCSANLELYYEVDQIGLIFDFKDSTRARGMFLRVLYKEIEEIISSKIIIMEGVLLSANAIKTVGVDGKWRKWYLWN
jgi:hypothetical protein